MSPSTPVERPMSPSTPVERPMSPVYSPPYTRLRYGEPGSRGMSWLLVPIIRAAVDIEPIDGQYAASLVGVDLFTRFVNELRRDFGVRNITSANINFDRTEWYYVLREQERLIFRADGQPRIMIAGVNSGALTPIGQSTVNAELIRELYNKAVELNLSALLGNLVLPPQPEAPRVPDTPARPRRPRRLMSNSAQVNMTVPQLNDTENKSEPIVTLTHEELLGGFEEYIARRTENINQNIMFLSNNDGKLINRLKSLHNKKNTLNVPNNQRAGGDAPIINIESNANKVNEVNAVEKNVFEVFYDILMEKRGEFNKKTWSIKY